MDDAAAMVSGTLRAARGGDLEAAGWVVVGVLSLALAVLAFAQVVVGGTRQRVKKRRGKPVAPPTYNVGMPLVGNVVAFARNPLGLVWDGYARKGPVFTVRFGHKRLTFLVGSAAHECFFKGSDAELDQAEPYRFSTPVFGKGVVYDAPLKKRLQHFRILSMTLRVNMLETYVPMMVREAEEFFESWEDEGEVDLLDAMSRLTVLTGSRCIMGAEVREQLFGEVSHLIHDLDQGMQPVSVLAPYLPTAAHRKRDRARAEMSRLFRPILAARREGKTRGDDMLQWLVDAKYREDGSPFSDEDVIGCLIAALFAAQHTSSATTTWIGMHLVHNPPVMARVRAEQDEVMGAGGGLDYAKLMRMDMLHAVMKEVLRMHPPLIFLMRKVLERRTALNGKYDIPVGDYVIVSPSISGMLPDVYAEPEKFDPDRFLAPRNEDRAAPYSFLAFGSGRHACMGEMFGYLQAKTVWSTLLRMYDFEPMQDAVPEPNYESLVVGPREKTCFVRYKRRR